MRCSVLLPLALALSASASLVLPLAATAGSQITRRQDECTAECGPVEDEINACGTELTCLCTDSIATGLEACAQCQYEADPTSQQTLQTALDQYASGCQASGQSVGSLTLSATSGTSSTSSVRSVSITSSSAITSVSTPPAFATSTSSVIASLSSATRSAIAGISSSASAATASQSGGLTGSGNGASTVGVQMTGAFVAAGIVAAFAAL